MNTPEPEDPREALLAEELDQYYRRLCEPDSEQEDETAEYGSDIDPRDVERLEKAKRCVKRLAMAAEKKKGIGNRESGVEEESSRQRGRRIGQFEIRSTLGAGGFGVVYRAYDPRTKREVAVKVPRIEALASEEMRRRFELEASATAKLDHPNIISVLEAGVSGTVPYIVSTYFHGPTLAKWLRDHKHTVSPTDAAVLVCELAQAVQHAHDRGVLHRDIKPSNVLLAEPEETSPSLAQRRRDAEEERGKKKESGQGERESGVGSGEWGKTEEGRVASGQWPEARRTEEVESGKLKVESGRKAGVAGGSGADAALGQFRPKLMDFGLAKVADSSANMTRSGAILGTARYMSPEQARGDQKAITTATDVYGLGAILFELLAGRAPFEGASDIEVMRKVTTDEPTRIRSVRASVPADLETICLKCLEKEPARRYRSAGELAADLGRYLDGEPIHARAAGTVERWAKWARRRPAAAGLIGLAVASAATLMAGSVWYSVQMSSAVRRTQASESRALASERQALAREQAARRMAYCADMRLIDDRWNGATYTQLKTVLERYVPETGQPDLRGFEWWLYWRELTTNQKWQRVGTHAGGVTAVAMRPDSTLAASAGKDGVIRLWRVTNGELSAELRGHRADDIDGLAFSPDGRLLASGGSDGEVRLWNVETAQELHVMRDHTDWVSSVAFSGDNKILGTCGGDRRIVLWDVASGRKKGELTGHEDTVRSVVFLKKRPLLISASEDGTIRTWDLNTLSPASERFESIPDESRWVRQIVTDPDETVLWGIVFNRLPAVWNLRDEQFGQFVERVNLQGNATSVALLRSKSEWDPVFGCEDSRVVAVQDASSAAGETYLGHSSTIRGVAAGLDQWHLVSGSADGDVFLWDIRLESRAIRTVQTGAKIVFAMISPNGERVCLCRSDGHVTIVDFDSEQVLATSNEQVGARSLFAFTPDSMGVWVWCRDDHARRLSSDTARIESEVPLREAPIELECSPSGRWILLNFKSGVRLIESTNHGNYHDWSADYKVHDVEFLDDETVMLACDDGWLRTWGVSALKVTGEVRLSSAPLGTVAVSMDGRQIAVGGYQSAWILDRSFATVATLPHMGDVRRVTYLGGGKTLWTQDRDSATRLWNTADWQEVGSNNPILRYLGDRVSRDGFRTVSLHSHRYLRLIDARSDSR